jgi:hypothetical protein
MSTDDAADHRPCSIFKILISDAYLMIAKRIGGLQPAWDEKARFGGLKHLY